MKFSTEYGKSVVIGLCYPDPTNREINQFYGDQRLDLYNQVAQKSGY